MEGETKFLFPAKYERALHLRNLCRQGAESVLFGKYDGVQFSLFNKEEADIVKAFMEKYHPTVPFGMDWINFDGKKEDQ